MRFWLFDDGLASSAPGFWRVARVRELNIEAPCASTRARGAFGLFLGVVLGFLGVAFELGWARGRFWVFFLGACWFGLGHGDYYYFFFRFRTNC